VTKSHLKDIPDLENHYDLEFLWNLHPTDSMSVVIYHWGKPVMSFFLGEAMEAAGFTAVMKHIDECNNTPWLTRWHKEKQDMEYKQVMDILLKDYENG